MKIGDRIRFRRQQLSMTQLQLDQQSGLPLGTIAQYETGHRVPSEDRLKHIAKSLGCKPSDLIDETGGLRYRSDALMVFTIEDDNGHLDQIKMKMHDHGINYFTWQDTGMVASVIIRASDRNKMMDMLLELKKERQHEHQPS